jgi:hypothetical protein
MSREIKFRVWDTTDHPSVARMNAYDPRWAVSCDGKVLIRAHDSIAEDNVWVDARLFELNSLIVEYSTGLHDRNGTPIYEGDIVLIGPANFESTLLNPEEAAAGDIPIYEVFTDKPLPAADVIYAKGVVRWDQSLCEYRCDYVWLCDSWAESGVAGGKLAHNDFTYEVVGNIHEQEQPAAKQESEE